VANPYANVPLIAVFASNVMPNANRINALRARSGGPDGAAIARPALPFADREANGNALAHIGTGSAVSLPHRNEPLAAAALRA